MDYPPNSKKPKVEPPEDKHVERVTSAQAVRRKKGLGSQFKETFIGGDLKTTAHYVIFDVMLPAAKDMLVDGASQGMERLIFGESRGPRRSSMMPQNGRGRINYNAISKPPMQMQMQMQAPPQRQMSHRAKAVNDFDEIMLQSRSEAELVIERLFDLVDTHGSASVADLYEMVGLAGAHTDNKWGWTDMRGADVRKLRGGGFVLNLPDPSAF